MKNWIFIIFLMLTACNDNQKTAQTDIAKHTNTTGPKQIEGLDMYSYAVHTEKDTIEYIRIGSDTLTPKPTLLFLQGSLPSPLVFDLGDFKHVNLPFDYNLFKEHFNIIEIAMPHTPVVAKRKNLNQDYNYVPDTAQGNIFDKRYLRNDFLENYVERTNHVIAEISKKSWFKKDSLIVIGHSQGAKIAAVVASENSHIAAVALLGFNAFGRYDEYIRRERQRLKSGAISEDAYKRNLKSHYDRWTEINAVPDDFEQGHRAWTTFSIDYLPYLLKIDTPIFVGYGTEDIIAENCDLLPLKFIEEGKSNLTLKPYIGLDHNFFELKSGVPDRRNGAHFADVIDDIIRWSGNEERSLVE